jgi:hypothetical protein
MIALSAANASGYLRVADDFLLRDQVGRVLATALAFVLAS